MRIGYVALLAVALGCGALSRTELSGGEDDVDGGNPATSGGNPSTNDGDAAAPEPEPPLLEPFLTGQDGVCGLAATDDNLYFGLCLGEKIFALPLAEGSAPSLVGEETGWLLGLDADAHAVYWANLPTQGVNPGGIERWDETTNPAQLIVTEGNIRGFALDREELFWTRAAADGSGAILTAGTSRQNLRILAKVPAAAFAVNEANVYFTQTGSPFVFSVPREGGELALVATSTGEISRLVLLEDELYYSDTDGLWQVPTTGGAPLMLDVPSDELFVGKNVVYYERDQEIVARRNERATVLGRIEGSVGDMVEANGWLYVAGFNSGTIYRTPVPSTP